MSDEQDLNQDEIKEFYDSVYYADATADNARHVPGHYFRLFNRLNIAEGANVLDVACGTGEWLEACARHDCEVSGVDLSPKAIAICEERLPRGKFFAQPAESLPFDDDTFDVITCLGSLEHFVDPVSSLKDFLTRRLGLFGGTYQVDAKEVVRTLERWDEIFNDGGLAVEERWKDLHVISFSWIKKGKIYLWPFRAVQALLLAIWPLRWQYQVYHRCVVRS